MALVITRKKGTEFWVGPIRITVNECDHGQAVIGIDAPKGFEILRGEVVSGRPLVPGKFEFPVPRDQVEAALAKWAEAQKEKVTK